MRWVFALALSLVCGAGMTAVAQNVSRLYPREKLEADAARWGDQIRAEYRETILPQLTDSERAALSATKIEIPLLGHYGDPFEFYYENGQINLPALSLRFYSDLCVANAWLNGHGYDGTTVRDYVGVLFREAARYPPSPLPPLFRTLGVPDNAREEPAVSNRTDRNFGNTILFLLAHELGHALKKHNTHSRDPVQKRKQEIEADQFAIEVMRRIGQMPLGIEFWFDVEHFRHVASTKVPTEAEWQKHLAALDHPVTTERLEALAVTIEKAADSFARNQTNQALWTQRTKMLAEAFRRMAPLANPVADMAEYSRVKKLYVADLKPRKAAFTMPGSEHEPEFNGLFAVRRTAASGAQDTVDLLLLRSGDDQVMGGYMNGKVDGFIQGDIKDGVLKFTWREGSATGHGIARSQGETLRGTWGTDEADQGGGEWVGVRVKRDTTR
ncbi:MAG: hypothetical protein DMF12_09110 [Verrucomicrobia bacterium]|nr:MAG: hypothetical protein DMF12_09110 [Verrucomicrobiota bacterium]